MARRSRNLKPGYFTNDVLCALPPLTRILFAGLWTYSDREGRCEDRPRKIKAELLPYDDCDVDMMLEQLHGAGFIDRYEIGGIKVIQVVTWQKHQNPHVKEAPSTLPARCKSGASTVQAPDKEQPKPERAGLIPSFLIPSSLIPDSLSTAVAEIAGPTPDLFERFWRVYPRKVGKPAALKAFQKAKPDEELLSAMLVAIGVQDLDRKCETGDEKFVPHPATWLNGRRWEDDPPQPPRRPAASRHIGLAARNFVEGVTDDGSLS